MPDLPDIEQDFIANVSRYVTALVEATAAAKAFADANRDAVRSVTELQAAIDAMEGKTVRVNVELGDVPTVVAPVVRATSGGVAGGDTGNTAANLRDVAAAGREASASLSNMNANIRESLAALTAEAIAAKDAAEATKNLGTSWERVQSMGRDFSASMIDTIAAVEATTGAEERLFAVNTDGITSFTELTAATRADAAAAREAAMANAELGAAARVAAEMANDAAASLDRERAVAALAAETSMMLANSDRLLAEAEGVLGDRTSIFKEELAAATAAKESGMAADTKAVAGAVATTAAVSGTAKALGMAAGWWSTWGTVVHWVFMGTMEFLAVAVPAFIALGAAMAVAYQGAQQVYTRLTAVYTVGEALGPTFNKTSGQLLGMGNSLQKAQDAANPLVWQALGGGIAAVNAQSGGLIKMGSQVLGVFDHWIASIDVGLQGAMGTTLTNLVTKGAADLQILAGVLGNVGHTIINLASSMPGLAEVIFRTINGFAGLLKAISSPSWWNFHGQLITIALAMEEGWRWGGILTTMFGGLVKNIGNSVGSIGAAGGAFETLGLKIRGAGKWIAGITGWQLALAGIGIYLGVMIVKWSQAGGAVEQYIRAMQQANNTATFSNGVKGLITDLPKLQNGLNQSTQDMKNIGAAAGQVGGQIAQSTTNVSTAQAALMGLAGGGAFVTKNLLSMKGTMSQTTAEIARFGPINAQATESVYRNAAAYQQAEHNQHVYQQGIQTMTRELAGSLDGATKIAEVFHTDLPNAYILADAAGIKLSNMFNSQGQISATSLQQIQNYINGYKIMSGNSDALWKNVAAVNVQIGLQNTKVGQLNGAWNQFLQNAMGGTQAWSGLQNDIQQIGQVADTSTSKFRAFKGSTVLDTSQIAQALKSFGGTSSQVWQNFNASLTQAGSVTDWWRTAAASGVVSQKQLTQGIATTTAQLLPFTQGSQAALSELMVLSQEAGGPAYNNTKSLAQNYQDLKNWTDKNALSTDNYNNMLGVTTSQMANVSQAAQHFSQTLQGDVVSAVANGSVNLLQITKDTQDFNTKLKNNVPQSTAVSGAMRTLATDFHGSGMNAQTAGSLIYQMGINQGLTKKQAYQLEQQMIGLYQQGFTPIINHPNIHTNVSVSGTGTWSLSGALFQGTPASTSGKGGILPTPTGRARGALIPGYGGGDVVPAMLEPGETVVPKHLTAAVAPLMKAHRVPGFAAGGVAGSYSGSAPGLAPWTIGNFNATYVDMAASVAGAIQGAISQQTKMLQQLMASGGGGGGGGGNAANIALGAAMAARYGWTGGQFSALTSLWNRESGWSSTATNASSGAAGIAQNISGYSGGYQKGNAAQQIAWGLQYILGRYGSPGGAWAHELAYGWYDQGGYLKPGLTLAYNGTGRPEMVGNPGGPMQSISDPGGPIHIHLNVGGREIAKAILPSLISETGKYGIRNSGAVTGLMKPS